MADVKNLEVHSFDVRPYGFLITYTVDIEFDTGHAFVVGGDKHYDRYDLQIFRDNNILLGSSHLE